MLKELSLSETSFLCSAILSTISKLNETKKGNDKHNCYRAKLNSPLLDIPILDYLNDISKIFKLDANHLILAMNLLDKKLLINQDFILNEYTMHKTFYICLIEIMKFYDDNIFSNKDYAKVGKLDVDELFDLELDFLTSIDFNVNINSQEFEVYKEKMKTMWSKLS